MSALESYAPMTERARVLVALLVYNGRGFVAAAVASSARLQQSGRHAVDVVVFDDASPDPGWSAELEGVCNAEGVGYYRTPRNLGIPRNMNLGLLRAEAAGYDYVLILNSDVILPRNLIDAMVESARARPTIASVTAWTNNASIFSLPNDDPDRWLTDVATVDRTAELLAYTFASSEESAVTIPVGVGFCLLIPTPLIAEIGLFDPVFGRGYCEEVDWCCRAVAAGYEHVLATTTFAYHIGSATNRVAGLLQPGEDTVHTNEAIIDERHPDYRDRVAAWEGLAPLDDVRDRALQAIVRTTAAERGYVVDASWLRREPVRADDRRVRITVQPDGRAPLVEAAADGWRCAVPVTDDGILRAIAAFVGLPPEEVRIQGRGGIAARLAEDARRAGLPVANLHRYPERV